MDDDDVETKRKERGVCTIYFRKEIVTDVMDDRLHILYKRLILFLSSSTIKSTVTRHKCYEILYIKLNEF